MFLRQVYDSSLAQAAYLIGCQATGEAIVIDPLRDITPYLQLAADEGLRIVAVAETHIHADFVSGTGELARATGARRLLSGEGGEGWQYGDVANGATLLYDGDRFRIGNIEFETMHTPGHTPEHLAFVVTDSPSMAGPMGIVSGDFVFVGDVGRPDLLERAARVSGSMEDSARALFASLDRFRALPDHLQVWPGHGAGSACGKALGAVPASTVGYEKRANWALQTRDEASFVEMALAGQMEPPRYFAAMKRLNKNGAPAPDGRAALDDALPLAPTEVLQRSASSWVIDLRTTAAFAEAHLPGAVSLPYGRQFATWAGSVLPTDADIIVLGSRHDAMRAIRLLGLVGFDRVIGWGDADAVLNAVRAAGGPLESLPARDIRTIAARHVTRAQGGNVPAADEAGTLPIVDVRDHNEWLAGHFEGALHLPLATLVDHTDQLPRGPFAVHCQSGVRSAIAVSALHRLGFTNATDLTGGYAASVSARKT